MMFSSSRLLPILAALCLIARLSAAAPRTTDGDPSDGALNTAATACDYAVSPPVLNLASGASNGTLNVTTTAECGWTAVSNVSWLTITSGAAGTGTGTIGYSVTANTGTERTGTLTIAGLTINVTQAAPAPTCTYTLTPTSQNFTEAAGTGNVAVTTSSGCFWRAVSNDTWITVTAGGAFTGGNGTVTYTVAANTSPQARTGTITIAGQTFTITQAAPGAGACSYTVTPGSVSIGVTGGTGSIAVTPNLSTCAWTAVSSVTWITITSGASGTGNGTVAYTVAENTGTLNRTGTITIGGVAVTVTQLAPSTQCTYVIAPTSRSFGAVGGTGSIGVTTSAPNCAWRAVSNATWITITIEGGSGTGNATFKVPSNGSLSGRSGTISVAGLTFTANQAGAPATASPPFGTVDTPAPGATGVTGSIAVTGWALDDIEVTAIRILRDPIAPEPAGTQVFVGNGVIVTGARPDVAAGNPTLPFNDRAGWGYLLLTNMLPNKGNGTYTLHAYADDRDGHATLLGSRTITCTNSTAIKPFGAIDTPGQGETISGANYVNFGWALTPLPKTIPIDGSTMAVFIDGVMVGRPTYNQFRSDIAALFPGLNNSNGAIGFLALNTGAFTDGVHTISWTVTDSAGSAEGIGSRYFMIKNLSALAADPTVLGTQVESRDATALRISPSGGSQEGIRVRHGYDDDAPFDTVRPDGQGVHHITTVEMARIVVDVANRAGNDGVSYRGFELVGDDRRALPIGASLDTDRGIFSWQPGPGFIGSYALLFERTDARGVTEQIAVRIQLERR